MRNDRVELLQQKAQVIEGELLKWADEQSILSLGERIHVHIEIERTLSVTSTILLPETNLGTPISELDLSVRTVNCLANANVTTVRQLCQKNLEELFLCRNFGRRCAKEVIWKLKGRGLTLSGNIPNEFLAESPFGEKKTVSEKEFENVEIREIKESDWKKMLRCLYPHPYMKETITILKDSGNKPIRADRILRNAVRRYPNGSEKEVSGTSMGSLYRINQQFKIQGLPYRLKPTKVPKRRHHVSERKLQIGFLKEVT